MLKKKTLMLTGFFDGYNVWGDIKQYTSTI